MHWTWARHVIIVVARQISLNKISEKENFTYFDCSQFFSLPWFNFRPADFQKLEKAWDSRHKLSKCCPVQERNSIQKNWI